MEWTKNKSGKRDLLYRFWCLTIIFLVVKDVSEECNVIENYFDEKYVWLNCQYKTIKDYYLNEINIV